MLAILIADHSSYKKQGGRSVFGQIVFSWNLVFSSMKCE